MAEIVNLRMARKARKRDADKAAAAQNRALSGRTKAQKLQERTEQDRAARDLDAHRPDGD
ncbi:DUF4169 family protein [Novosphingobium sp.]|uniref:DUF4169 family protein n=1 Tax=Novosphingobium sp. TaxID=1874826 RepID=UPI00286D755A|nr:DUF4169 family protein [Novosphingobium sp.]